MGETALIVAVQQRQPPVVKLLLEAGANPDKADHAAGYSARDYAKRDTRSREILQADRDVKQAESRSPAKLLVAVAERRIDLRRQPARGAAGEAQQLPPCAAPAPAAGARLAHDRRVIAVGDDQPGRARAGSAPPRGMRASGGGTAQKKRSQ